MGFAQPGTFQDYWREWDSTGAFSLPWGACTSRIVYITATAAGTETTINWSAQRVSHWLELQQLAETRAVAKANTNWRAVDDRRVRRRAPPVTFEWSKSEGHMHPTRPPRGRDVVASPRDLRPTARRATPPTPVKLKRHKVRERKCPRS